jgi:hypothetical protein
VKSVWQQTVTSRHPFQPGRFLLTTTFEQHAPFPCSCSAAILFPLVLLPTNKLCVLTNNVLLPMPHAQNAYAPQFTTKPHDVVAL